MDYFGSRGSSGGRGAEDGWWTEEMEKAVEAYREAKKLGGGLWNNGEVLFHLAVALEVCRWGGVLLWFSFIISLFGTIDLMLHYFEFYEVH